MGDKKTCHSGHRNRFRKKFLSDPKSLNDMDLLEILLFYTHKRCNTNGYSHNLFDKFADINSVFAADPETFSDVEGIGKKSVELIKLVDDICKELVLAKSANSFSCFDTAKLRQIVQDSEGLYLMSLDAQNNVIKYKKAEEDSLANMLIQFAVFDRASLVLIVRYVKGRFQAYAEEYNTLVEIEPFLYKYGTLIFDYVLISDKDFVSVKEIPDFF